MSTLRRVFSPAPSNRQEGNDKKHTNYSRPKSLLVEKTTGQAMMKNGKTKMRTDVSSNQPNIIKCLTDLEEYLEEVCPTSILYTSSNSTAVDIGSSTASNSAHQKRSSSLPDTSIESGNDAQFWYDIRQKMLEIVELTCQTQNFNLCCSGDKTSRLRYGCPFESSATKKSTTGTTQQGVHHSYSVLNVRSVTVGGSHQLSTTDRNKLNIMRRGSSPVTSTRPLQLRRIDSPHLNISYGGFEGIVNSFNDSAFTFEDEQDETSSSKSGNQFRRDLHAPFRRKKHYLSTPCVAMNGAGTTVESTSQLMSVKESMY